MVNSSGRRKTRRRYSKKRYSKKRYSKKRYSKKRYSKKRYSKNKRGGSGVEHIASDWNVPPPPEPEPEPEPAADAATWWVNETLRRLKLEKYSGALLSDAGSVMKAATGNANPDVLRDKLNELGVKKIAHRERLVKALYEEPTAGQPAGLASWQMGPTAGQAAVSAPGILSQAQRREGLGLGPDATDAECLGEENKILNTVRHPGVPGHTIRGRGPSVMALPEASENAWNAWAAEKGEGSFWEEVKPRPSRLGYKAGSLIRQITSKDCPGLEEGPCKEAGCHWDIENGCAHQDYDITTKVNVGPDPIKFATESLILAHLESQALVNTVEKIKAWLQGKPEIHYVDKMIERLEYIIGMIDEHGIFNLASSGAKVPKQYIIKLRQLLENLKKAWTPEELHRQQGLVTAPGAEPAPEPAPEPEPDEEEDGF
jgi:hypothetical protein